MTSNSTMSSNNQIHPILQPINNIIDEIDTQSSTTSLQSDILTPEDDDPDFRQVDLGFLTVGEIHQFGWIASVKSNNAPSSNKLDPLEIVIPKNTALINIYKDGEVSKQITSTNPEGFTRQELAETLAAFYMEYAIKEKEDESDMFATCNGTLDTVYVDDTTKPITVHCDLDY